MPARYLFPNSSIYFYWSNKLHLDSLEFFPITKYTEYDIGSGLGYLVCRDLNEVDRFQHGFTSDDQRCSVGLLQHCKRWLNYFQLKRQIGKSFIHKFNVEKIR